MSVVSQALHELTTWWDGVLGDPLSAALVKVRAIVARNGVETELRPEVQAFADGLDSARSKIEATLAAAAPFASDPLVATRMRELVEAWQLMSAAWADPAATKRLPNVGAAPIVWAALLTVTVVAVGVSYAVSEVGAAQALSQRTEVEKLGQMADLYRTELEARQKAAAAGLTLPPSNLPQLFEAGNLAGPKTGLSTAAKVGIGLGTLGLVALGVGVAVRVAARS